MGCGTLNFASLGRVLMCRTKSYTFCLSIYVIESTETKDLVLNLKEKQSETLAVVYTQWFGSHLTTCERYMVQRLNARGKSVEQRKELIQHRAHSLLGGCSGGSN